MSDEFVSLKNSKIETALAEPINLKMVKMKRYRSTMVVPASNDGEDELVEAIDDEEKYLHEDRTWNSKLEELTLDKLQKEEMDKFKGEWHWDQFLEFLMYHIVFFIICGPLMPILFSYKPGMTLMRNMQFNCGCNAGFIVQTILWIGSAFGGIGYFLLDGSVVSFTEVLFLWFALFIRAVVIAAKYATFSKERILMYKKSILSPEQLTFDLMMADWRVQSPKILFIEPYRSLRRNQFEISLFKFNFLVPLQKDTHQKIMDIKVDYYQDVNIETTPSIYSGFSIFGYLVNEFQSKTPSKSWMMISAAEAAIMALTPVAIKIITLIDSPPGYLDTARILVNSLVSFYAFFGSYIFFHLAFYDFYRKYFIIEQCLYMLKVTPYRYSNPKLLSTINFNNLESLQAWQMLRMLAFDYGQTYNKRTQGFFAVLFLGFIAIIVITLLMILGFLELSIEQMIYLGEIAIGNIFYTVYYLYLGAKLNSYFNEFEIAIIDIKSLYMDLMRMKEVYFEEMIEPQNFVHKRFVRMLNKECGKDLKYVEEVIKAIIQELDDNLRQVEFDRRNSPFKLYGVVVSFNLLKSAGVGLSTVYSYALQQRFMTSI